MEPILVEDLTFKTKPETVRNLIEFLETTRQVSNNDILAGLVYILFLETGFVASEDVCEEEIETWAFHYKKVLKLSKKLPNNWKNKNDNYNFKFILDPYQEQTVNVNCFSTGGDLVVNCVVQNIEDASLNTVCLDPLLYFLDSNTTLPHKRLQNLKHLSVIVKNFAYSAKQEVLKANNQIYMCLEAQPIEIILKILSYLNIKDLLNFQLVNKFCAGIVCTEKLWINLLEKDFGKSVESSARRSWRTLDYTDLIQNYRSFHRRKRATIPSTQFRSFRFFIDQDNSDYFQEAPII